MKNFILTLFFLTNSMFVFHAIPEQFMKIAAKYIIVDNKLCYQIRPGYSRMDVSSWVPYCGELTNFSYEQGFEYTVRVAKYAPEAPSINVISVVGLDNSAAYRKLMKLKRKKAQTLNPEMQARLQASNDDLVRVQLESKKDFKDNNGDKSEKKDDEKEKR